jgi:hypothetical protein
MKISSSKIVKKVLKEHHKKKGKKMAANTSTLPQISLKQSNANQNNNGLGMSARSILPNLLINAGVPFLINMLARPYMSTIDALLRD